MPATGSQRSSRQVTGDDIVIETAWLYYENGLNQTEIAARLDVSRATVVNYLQLARERGHVQVRLSHDAFTGHRLAMALRDAFGLAGAFVVPDQGGIAADIAARVVRGAADWLPSLLAPGDRLGVAWGKTIYDLSEALEPRPIAGLTVLQLVGSMATPYGFSADVCSSNVAHRLGASCVNLHVPAILSEARIARMLRAEHLIAAQFDAINSFTKTLFAVGSCGEDSHVVSSGVATRQDLAWYLGQGAVGVLCGRFIDRAGAHIEGPLDDRMMAVDLARMRDRDAGILVVAGPERITAAVAAIRGGYATHLVTSVAQAEGMLALAR
ncbi:sugar-binding transcriptional regulator [Meridianimarinicoccus sp. RP-17]|uniref:sugar-binding transcriptional regulator n=1 Tax=Meridianimarinicoccus zhengii TaxID=2056810 RepID=UPI000DAE8CCD|nr:sugar-binding domain-containing protein [Phycocomes zhengii]